MRIDCAHRFSFRMKTACTPAQLWSKGRTPKKGKKGKKIASIKEPKSTPHHLTKYLTKPIRIWFGKKMYFVSEHVVLRGHKNKCGHHQHFRRTLAHLDSPLSDKKKFWTSEQTACFYQSPSVRLVFDSSTGMSRSFLGKVESVKGCTFVAMRSVFRWRSVLQQNWMLPGSR